MTHKLKRRTPAHRQRGTSMVEYLILATALAVTLFASGSPVGQMVTDAMRAFYASVTFFLSLP